MRKLFLSINFLIIIFLYTNIECYKQQTQKIALKDKDDEQISPLEDLMREHGLLNRLLLIYEEIIKKIDYNDVWDDLKKSLNIIQSFIHNYHEKLEENYIFPIFKKNRKELKTIKILQNQHIKGRKITQQLTSYLSLSHSAQKIKKIKKELRQFVTMYRPHEAREDTVLFPQLHKMIDAKEFNELGEVFENLEHKLFGVDGFESIVKQVTEIEKNLKIYELEKFTPH